ncbi:hypothetical protein DVH24_003587 [Malus domestica]|uniref:Uncharacterized protein n=1 Tax=Malus domestica TaxID=3750 RepID=A0A498IIY0_MALDO|nr:hypothetical protein DVH24_003587 [Malus domestica]
MHQHLAPSVGIDTKSYVGPLLIFHLTTLKPHHRETAHLKTTDPNFSIPNPPKPMNSPNFPIHQQTQLIDSQKVQNFRLSHFLIFLKFGRCLRVVFSPDLTHTDTELNYNYCVYKLGHYNGGKPTLLLQQAIEKWRVKSMGSYPFCKLSWRPCLCSLCFAADPNVGCSCDFSITRTNIRQIRTFTTCLQLAGVNGLIDDNSRFGHSSDLSRKPSGGISIAGGKR